MSSSDIVRPTVSLPKDLDEEIEERLDYGDSKSAWIRETIEMRLAGELTNGDENGDITTER